MVFAVELNGDFARPARLAHRLRRRAGVTVLLMRRSILTEKLARRGATLTREYASTRYACCASRT